MDGVARSAERPADHAAGRSGKADIEQHVADAPVFAELGGVGLNRRLEHGGQRDVRSRLARGGPKHHLPEAQPVLDLPADRNVVGRVDQPVTDAADEPGGA
jgi:hypothetical protein